MRRTRWMPANSFNSLEGSTGPENFWYSTLHEILDRHVGFSIQGVEGEFLSGRFACSEDVAVLCRAIFDDRNQLHVPSHSRDENNRQLEGANTREIPVRAKSAAEDHALVKAPRLRRHAGVLLQSRWRARRTTWPRFVSASANIQERCRCAELISARTPGDACCVRISYRIMVRPG